MERPPVEVDELVEHWTVLEDEQQLVAGRLTPLFWMHLLPYGEVHLDMSSRLRLGPGA